MSVFEARCTSCGAPLEIREREKISTCKYCHNTVVVSHAKELGLVEIDKTKDLETYRSNLAVAVMHNSLDELQRIGGQIKDLIPNDFRANYYFAYAKQQRNQPKFMYQFLHNTYEYTKEEYKEILEHIIRRSDLRDKPRILDFIKRTEETYQEQYSKMHHEREQAEDNYAVIPRDVFVCFSSFNQEIAEEVVKKLEEDGNTCWISTRNLRPEDSENYWTNIEQAIDHTEIVLVVSSEDAMRSKDVQQEVRFAKEKNKKLVEFKIDQKPHSTLFKHIFDGNKWVNGKKNVNQDYTSLLQRVYEEKHESKAPTDMVGEYIPKRRRNKRVGLGFFALALVIIGGFVGYLMMNAGTGDEVLGSEEDTEAPVIELKGLEDITLEVGQQFVDPGVTVSDNQEQDIQAVVVGNVDTTELGAYLITYYATDQAGNQATSVTRTVHVTDSLAPIITINGQREITLEVHSTYNDLGARVNDNYDENVSLDIDGSVDTSVLGTYEITYNAMDSLGNEAVEVIRTVHVVDTTAPTISMLGEEEYYININGTYVEYGVSTNDNYDHSFNVDINGSVDTSVEGVYTFTYQAIDGSGNESVILSRTVEVIDFEVLNQETPIIMINGESEISLEVNSTYIDLGARVADDYEDYLILNESGTAVVNETEIGTYTITYSAIDNFGNEAVEVIRTVHVVDTTAPTISMLGEEEYYININGTYVEYGVSTNDNYDQSFNVDINGSVDTSVEGIYTLTYQVTDSSGNKSVVLTRTVEVIDFLANDNEAPVITLQGDSYIVIEVGNTYEDLGVTIEDNYSQNLTASVSGSVDTSTLGRYEIIYNVTDEAGNVAEEVIRTIVVEDNTSPTLSLNGLETITISIGSDYNEEGVTVSDNFDSIENLTIVINGTVDVETEGTYIITYQAIDGSSNESVILTRTIVVNDFIADFTWDLKDDGTYEVTGYVGTDSDVTIPNQVSGIDVTSIGIGAFENSLITSVYIPASIEIIHESAFKQSERLSSITFEPNSLLSSIGDNAFFFTSIFEIDLPEGLEEIGDSVFRGTNLSTVYIPESVNSMSGWTFYLVSDLESIIVDENNPYYTSIDGVLFNDDITMLIKYPPQKGELSYDIPGTVLIIREYAFQYLNNISELIIPEGVVEIENYAFQRSMIVELSLPSTLKTISARTFWGMFQATGFSVHKDNMNFTSIDGVLFNKEVTELITYPTNNSRDIYEVPYGTEVIGNDAFDGSGNLRNIILPRTLETIEEQAFQTMSNLREIFIPNSVSVVGEGIFEGSDYLQIFVEAAEKPIGWDVNWNSNDYPVTWGATYVSNPDYKFKLLSNGTYEIIDYLGMGGDLIIPAMNNGKAITSIAHEAFNQSNLTSVFIPNTIEFMALNPFIHNDQIMNFIVDERNPNFISVDGVLFNIDQTILISYPVAKTTTSYTIPDTVLTLEPCAFYNASYLTNLIIPEGVTTIKWGVFSEQFSADLVLPSTIYDIQYGGGIHNSQISNLYVNENNLFFQTIDGVLFSKDGKTLIAYPGGKTDSHYEMPLGAEVIPTFAISNEYISDFVIAASVLRIEERAFNGAYNISSIFIPESVTIIEAGAFILYSSVSTTIYVESTEEPLSWDEDWNLEGYPVIWGYDFNSKYFTTSPYMDGLMITGYSLNGPKDVVIPDQINGQNVLAIGDSAFRDMGLNSVVLPDTLLYIDFDAFSFNNLEEVSLGPNVSDLEAWAFRSNQISSYYVNPNNTSFKSVDGVLFDFEMTNLIAYPMRKSDISYLIPETVTIIGEGAFSGQIFLEHLDIPEGLNYIENGAFQSAISILELNLPSSLWMNTNDSFPFENMSSCTNIFISETNPFFTSVDGVLFSKDLSQLIAYPAGKTDLSFNIPSGTTEIGSFAFAHSMLEEITIPNTVFSIGYAAFRSVGDLQDIFIPSSVMIVDRDAFSSLNSSLEIFVEAISKPGSWDMDWNPTNNIIHWGSDNPNE